MFSFFVEVLLYQTASYLFKGFRLNLFIEVVIERLGLCGPAFT